MSDFPFHIFSHVMVSNLQKIEDSYIIIFIFILRIFDCFQFINIHLLYKQIMETRKFIKKSKILIINADDYGCQPEIDEGILELWKNENIKSFSVIVNQRNSEKAIQRIMEVKKTNSKLYQQTSIGIHFNLTRGRALSQDMKNSPFVQNGLFIKQKVLKQMHQLQVISKQTIANELTAQVELFIKLLRRRPSHLDSHNYLHIFPYFAEIIAPIIVKFGIYRIRNIIIGNLESLTNKYELNFSQSVRSYQQHNIQSTDIFLGYQDAGNLSVSKIKETFQDNLKQKSFVSIQLMCHPGYPTCNQQSWMGKNDRLKEKNQLQGQQFQKLSKQIGGIASYFDLQKPVNMLKHKRLLIYSKLLTGTGNLTTSMRLRLIFQKLGYEVYTWSVQHEIDFDVQVEDLSKFLYNFNISLIIGINVSRSAQIIHEAVFSKTKITIQVPYILIIAGTDANINFKKYQTLVEYKESLKDCQCLVSLSSTMAALSEEALKMLNIHKKIYTISQSSFSPYMCNSLPFIIKAPYILYPTSFRQIKCVQHILVQLNTIIDTYNFQVILIGPIIETEYYQKLKSQLKKIKYLGQVSQQYSLSLMKHAFMVINTSIEQGMSCSILQAFTYKIPVVARNNSGNSQLIKNGYNGLLYQHPSQFQIKFKLLLSDAQLKQSMAEKAYQLVIQKYNFQDQLKKYGQMIEIQIEKKTMILQIGNSQIKVFNQQFVHNTSVVNNTAYLQMQPQFKEEINILDLGCGTAIFSLIFMLKAKYSTINLHLSDIDPLILGNALYNCRQSSFKHQIRSITLYQSNLFQNIDSTIRFDIVLFCPPQTPFRLNQSRPDKNGGPDSLSYFQPFFLHISNFSNDCRSYLMHSSMAWPSKCQQLLKRYNLQIKWRSKKGIHIIHKDEYNKMQQNLQALIMQHCKNGRAEIELKDDLFYVPIQLYLIQKFCQ